MSKKKKTPDYWGTDPDPDVIFVGWLASLFVEGGIVLILYIIFKIFS